MFAHDAPRRSVQLRTLAERNSLDGCSIARHPGSWIFDCTSRRAVPRDRGTAVSSRSGQEHHRTDPAARRSIRRRRAPPDRVGRRNRCRCGAADSTISIRVQWNTHRSPPHRGKELARIRPDLTAYAVAATWRWPSPTRGEPSLAAMAPWRRRNGSTVWEHCNRPPASPVSTAKPSTATPPCSSTGSSTSSSRRSATNGMTLLANGSSTTRQPWATASCSGTTVARRRAWRCCAHPRPASPASVPSSRRGIRADVATVPR